MSIESRETTVQQRLESASSRDHAPLILPSPTERVAVDGIGFAYRGSRVRIQGATYGPFLPNGAGEFFPDSAKISADFAAMRAAGINAIRTYHVPPERLLAIADEESLFVLVDVPWRKHVCFLDSAAARREARRSVAQAAQCGRRHSSVFAYSIGNEISTDIIRWHGARRVQNFLAELRDVAKQADPSGLVTYASFPSTEYLDLSEFDFATFNVYLHDRETFRRYLFRLQNLVGDQPLVLGELGMDSIREGEPEQANFLDGQLREARLMGVAGSFVFSWTDDWYTGGGQIDDWAFGITRRDRSPKPAYHALKRLGAQSDVDLLGEKPRVSVVVCTYNGGTTLEQCLRSLDALSYPQVEIIVVDDGSTDNTHGIVARFPTVRAIHQSNQGLSAARNVGLHVATGSIVAYTDSDCFVDADWLTHLVYQLQQSQADAVGGPNLTPDDGRIAACVATAPGQPTHVLESDQVAEHIPGCNMAFRREALLAINGFDTQFRKAGDDVDVCWRLQQAGYWITFAPGAFVWHHRRQGFRAYLRQQAGYGEAEGLLRFKHPDRFNEWGNGKWRGVLYGNCLQGVRLDGAVIYHGTFGRGLFQTIYQPGPAHWVMLPATLEWHVCAGLLACLTLLEPMAGMGAALLLLLSIMVAGLQAAQARIEPRYDGLASRLLVALLCHMQPLVRSWRRYQTRYFSPRMSASKSLPESLVRDRIPLHGTRTISYWSEAGVDRTALLTGMVDELSGQGWGRVVDSGWSEFDLQIPASPGAILQICTTQEEHGGGKRLIRVRYRLRSQPLARICGCLLLATTLELLQLNLDWGAAFLVLTAVIAAFTWLFALRGAKRTMTFVDRVARELQLIRVDATPHDVSIRPQASAPG